jgi:hypothetical protein
MLIFATYTMIFCSEKQHGCKTLKEFYRGDSKMAARGRKQKACLLK